MSSTFKKALIKRVLELSFESDSTRVKNDSVEVAAEMLRIMTAEVVSRACDNANLVAPSEPRAGAALVDAQHVEAVLPQLLLDF